MAQFLVQGLSTGMIYGLIGIGFVVIYRTVGLFNFAHSESYMLGALAAFSLVTSRHFPYYSAIFLAGVFCALVGMLSELVAFRRLIVARAPQVNLIIASIALATILRAAALLTWGPDAQAVTGLEGNLSFGSVVLDKQYALIGLAATLAIVLVWVLLYRTQLGLALRAVAENRTVASLLGVDIRLTLPLAFGLAGMLGGVAGSLVAPLFFAQFRMGQAILVKAFAAGVLGGLDSVPGAIVGGLVIGVLESLVGGYVSSVYKDLLSFVILMIVLVIRPSGILGGRQVEKV